jgi:YVTN family beta-propeller protein
MNALTRLALAGLVLAAAAPALAQAAPAPRYAVVADIPGPDGYWDYASFDPSSRRVYVSRDYGVMAVDLDSGTATPRLASGARVHATVPLPGGKTLLTTNGETNSAAILDAASGAALASIPTGKGPDGAVYDPFSGLVLVMNGKSGEATLIDPVARQAVGSIAVGGELEFPASDGQGRVYVNVADKAEIAVLDVKARKVVGHYALAGCEDPSGLAYVAGLGALVSVCDNGVAKVVAAADGRELASLTIGKGPDAVIVDAERKLAFVPSGYDGTLSVIDIADRAHLAVIEQVATKHGAHTGALDPKTGKLYLPTCDYGPPAQPGGRRPHLAGTFGVLVVAPQ